MQLIYDLDGKEFTLEELVKKFPEEWKIAIETEYHFWKGSTLYDIIIEASDEFEEILAEDDIFIVFTRNNDEKFDLNILLFPILDITQ